MECRSFLWDTLDPHFAAHELDQSLADGQTKSGAAVLPRRRSVRLTEGLEEARQPVHGNADAGVANPEMQTPMSLAVAILFRRGQGFDLYHHLTSGSEFDAVAEQVHEHLSQAGDVSDHGLWNPIVHLVGEVQALLCRSGSQEIQGVLDAGAQLERLVLQFQLARLDLREVENVVNDSKEGVAAGINGVHETMLLVSQGRFEQQPRHGDDAVHGGADFVAHVGEELRLGAGGRLGGDAGGQQLPIGLRQVILQTFGA